MRLFRKKTSLVDRRKTSYRDFRHSQILVSLQAGGGFYDCFGDLVETHFNPNLLAVDENRWRAGDSEFFVRSGCRSIELVEIGLIGDSAIETRAVDAHASGDLAQCILGIGGHSNLIEFRHEGRYRVVEFVLAPRIRQHEDNGIHRVSHEGPVRDLLLTRCDICILQFRQVSFMEVDAVAAGWGGIDDQRDWSGLLPNEAVLEYGRVHQILHGFGLGRCHASQAMPTITAIIRNVMASPVRLRKNTPA